MKTHVSAFAGVGSMDIAAERLGYQTTVAIENDQFCQKVIAKRFPSAKILGDIKEVSGDQLAALSGGKIDLLSGGFPCQNLSSAGKGEGLSGDRSGLWFEMLRLIGEARPEMVLIENVAVLKSRGLDVVVDGLARAGYGCWWDVVSALAVGAPHLRERIWIVAVPYERMPELDGEPFSEPRVRMPRAGASTARGLIEMVPCATQKAAKVAMGAVRRADGVTWLESIDTPLFPTPSSSSYGSNQGEAAGRVGPIRHSLESMARSGEWPRNATANRTPGGIQQVRGNKPTSAHGEQRVFPTPCQRDWKGSGLRVDGTREGHHTTLDSLPAVTRMWPTPRASANELRTTRSAPSHGSTHGLLLSAVVCDTERDEGRVVPPPSQSAGSLSPDWVEWLMGLPISWTDLSCDDTVQLDWLSEYGIPRVLRDVVDRKGRLMACGNTLVWKVAYTRLAHALVLLGEDVPIL